MLMRLSMLAVGMCMAMSVLTAHADVYKWTDADGRVHYGDQPASGAQKVNAGVVNDANADVPEGQAGDVKQKKAEECSRKRDQLTSYTKASKIVETDSLGSQKEFNEDERKKLLERTQQQVTDSCGDATDDAAAK